MSDKITITFDCKSCGQSPTTLKLPDDYTDDSIASCKNCGTEFGRYGDVKAKAMDAAKANVEDTVRKAFKGLKGWKIK